MKTTNTYNENAIVNTVKSAYEVGKAGLDELKDLEDKSYKEFMAEYMDDETMTAITDATELLKEQLSVAALPEVIDLQKKIYEHYSTAALRVQLETLKATRDTQALMVEVYDEEMTELAMASLETQVRSIIDILLSRKDAEDDLVYTSHARVKTHGDINKISRVEVEGFTSIDFANREAQIDNILDFSDLFTKGIHIDGEIKPVDAIGYLLDGTPVVIRNVNDVTYWHAFTKSNGVYRVGPGALSNHTRTLGSLAETLETCNLDRCGSWGFQVALVKEVA